MYRDFNLELFKAGDMDPELVDWYVNDAVFLDKALFRRFDEKFFASEMTKWIDSIEAANPRWLGISLMSFRCKIFFRHFVRRARERLPDIKIVIGGGLVDERRQFREKALANGLCDAYVAGEGERSLVSLLSGDLSAEGINGRRQTVPMDQYGQLMPDYTDIFIGDYGFDDYELTSVEPSFFFESSRGCVQKCRFCNVPQTEFSYRFRDPEKVVDEIRNLNRQFGVSYFRFADSLVNGSVKHFLDFCRRTKELNATLQKPIRLHGYFIIRSERKFLPAYFDEVAAAGFRFLSLGVESGSESVRQHMRKKYKNEDLYYTLDQLLKHRIQASLLFMVGYPTETEEDFQQTLQMLDRLGKYREIINIKCSWKVAIKGQNSQLNDEAGDMGIEFNDNGNWANEHVNTAISAERYRRFCRRVEANRIPMITKVSDHVIDMHLEAAA